VVAQVFVETDAVVGCRAGTVVCGRGIYGIEARIRAKDIRKPLTVIRIFMELCVGNRIVVRNVGYITPRRISGSHTARSGDLHDIDRQDAVGGFGKIGTNNQPIRMTGGSVHQIDGLRTFGETRVFVTAGEIETQSRYWFPRRL